MAQYQNIHWFPGHMKVALDGIKKLLPQTDLVIEIGDARAPVSSFNLLVEKLVSGKRIVRLYSKRDLADEVKLQIILEKNKKEGKYALALDLKKKNDIKQLVRYLSSIKSSKQERYERLGLTTPPTKALIVGIPNVGKSTLINSLVGSKKASVANKPGHTKSTQMIKVSDKFVLFDTPGVLEPNYEDKDILVRLAWLGSIKLEILPLKELTDTLLDFLLKNYKQELIDRYSLVLEKNNMTDEVFNQIAANRRYLTSGDILDIERTRLSVLKDFQSGLLGKVVVDDVDS